MRREVLWKHPEGLNARIQKPWLVTDEFDKIILPYEQHGDLFYHTRALMFVDCIHSCGLLDLGFFGTQFNWQKRCMEGWLVSNKLDISLSKPFRFQDSWCTHEEYEKLIQSVWKRHVVGLNAKLHNIVEAFNEFNLRGYERHVALQKFEHPPQKRTSIDD
ncbi:hypothetical protein VNO78_34693 [Psophocarpus tetragonolobus]|uniref:Uncharacterized protein n=1 Tax=Psophocarpus tetragonolobus TaxID=3891 RepID=A0AAN9NP91_PSOTE